MASGGAPGFKGRPARNSWRVRAVPRGQWRAAVPRVLRKARTVAAPVRTPPIFPPVVRHLYVHIPFCIRRCSYCDFSIAVRKRIPAGEYVDAVLQEAASNRHADLETIYLGGGTPSLLPPESIATLVHELALKFRNPQS